jgi:hypothetical protein
LQREDVTDGHRFPYPFVRIDVENPSPLLGAEGFFDCMAARPEERDAGTKGRHSAQNDRGLLIAEMEVAYCAVAVACSGIGILHRTGGEGFVDCMAARPEERDARKGGPPFRSE